MSVLVKGSICVALIGIMSGCYGGRTNPSEESRFLDDVLIPQIIRWKSGPDSTFEFRNAAVQRGYDYICLVPEYDVLGDIRRGGGPTPRRYFSSFGTHVPEMKTALVVVIGDTAHAALIDGYAVSMAPPDVDSNCVSARSASFVRVERERPRASYVRLDE